MIRKTLPVTLVLETQYIKNTDQYGGPLEMYCGIHCWVGGPYSIAHVCCAKTTV